MLRLAPAALLLMVAGCGGDPTQDALENAADQSDPAAAAVLENSADAGVDPQVALERAGDAQLKAPVPKSTLQAKPNLPTDSNRPSAGQPPEKIDVEAGAAENEHAGHDMGNSQ